MSTANVSKLAIAWSFSPWGTGWSLSSPVMAGGAVYVSALRKSDNHMYLIALDPGTGSVLWNLYVGVNAPPALSGYTPPGPAVDNGLVYASYYSQSGGFTFVRIAAIDVASHLVKWTWVSPGASAFLGNSELAVSNGLLVLGFRDFVASVDATTGATLTYLLSNPSFPDRAMPVVFGTVAYMADEFMADSFPSALHAKNAKTGAWIWSNIGLSPNGVATWYANSLALSSSKLFFGANLAGLDIVHAVDTTTGGDLWYTLVDGRVYQPPAVAANTVYGKRSTRPRSLTALRGVESRYSAATANRSGC